jgi:site-specific DNA-methyltransferase (adenine-specific)
LSVTLHLGDCLDVLKALEPCSVDAVVTDPPYGMGCNLNSKRFTGGNRALRPVEGRDDWPPVAGDQKPFDPSPWLRYPKVVLWGANHYADRLPKGTTLVWIKRNDSHFGTFLSDAEIAWQKGGCGIYCFRQVFQPPTRAKEGLGRCAHPMQKPVALMRWCLSRLKLSPGATVLDPYMGSGTVGVACVQMDLNYIGIEISEEYYAIAQRRIEAARNATPLFSEAALA